MRSTVAALLAASLTLTLVSPAACAPALAADPFTEVPLPPPTRHAYGWAILTFVAGAGLIGTSFGLSDHANQEYAEYRRATDPGRISSLYDAAVHDDRLSTASLLAGEVMIGASLYIGFLRRTDAPRLSIALGPERCALALRF